MHKKNKLHNLDVTMISCLTLLILAITLPVLLSDLANAQTFKVIYAFTGGKDGANPHAGLTLGKHGELYGTTANGGIEDQWCSEGCGTAFQLRPQGSGWSFNLLHAFHSSDGDGPNSNLTLGDNGELYGTTVGGGFSHVGTVFRLTPSATGKWNQQVIYNFLVVNNDGRFPWGAIVGGPMVWGTTFGGGAYGNGTIYVLGLYGELVLHSFRGGPDDGALPQAGLVPSVSEGFYGTTASGGQYGKGTIYHMTPYFPYGRVDLMYSFRGQEDGMFPSGELLSGQGLFGTTHNGGLYGGGTVFEFYGLGYMHVLHSFSGTGGPEGGLIADEEGNLYGTTALDGAFGRGNVFKLTRSASGGWGYTSLHDFTGADGARPICTLIRDSKGHLYGTTADGGEHGYGVVWEITP